MTNEQYHSLIPPYHDAMELILTRLEMLNHKVYDCEDLQPIHSITSRIKEKDSMRKNLRNRTCPQASGMRKPLSKTSPACE